MKNEQSVTAAGTAPQEKPLTVADMGPEFHLEQDSQDIEATLSGIGQLDKLNSVGCLFTEVLDGDYGRVYACPTFVPWNQQVVFQLN